MTILYLDTSSSFLYTAIKKDDEIIAEIKEKLDNNLSKFALSRIEGMFKIKNISYDEIDKIIVVHGPEHGQKKYRLLPFLVWKQWHYQQILVIII